MIRLRNQSARGIVKSFSVTPSRCAQTTTQSIRRRIRPPISVFTPSCWTILLKNQPSCSFARCFATSNGSSQEKETETTEVTSGEAIQTKTTSELCTHLFKQLKSPPNVITTFRIMSAPYLSYLIVTENYELAFYGCCAAGLSDILDGYLARHYNMSTVLGTYLDPLADKIIINVLAASLWYNNILPTPLVSLWLLRDVAFMVGTYIYVRSNTGKGQWVADPVTTPLKVEPTMISKVNTGLQFLTLSIGLLQPIYALVPPEALVLLCWLTGGTTIASIFSYAGMSAFTNSGNSVISNSSFVLQIREKTNAMLQHAKKVKSMKGGSSK